jgi:3-vinyl bacteriochlorophyllide hydratase
MVRRLPITLCTEERMAEIGPLSVRDRRKASIWTLIHPLFAIGQLLAFFVSVGLFVGYFLGAVPFHAVHVSVLVKIGLMVGAVLSGSFWERDVFGYWWFAPEFLFEDVMTLIVFITQLSYLAVVAFHPQMMNVILGILAAAYLVYIANVAQYIHRTQRAKKETAAAEAAELKQAA